MTEANGDVPRDRSTTVTVSAPLDAGTAALISFAAAIAGGEDSRIVAAADHLALQDGVDLWADELLLQSILMVGYPRALVGAAIWRDRSGTVPTTEPGDDVWSLDAWKARGIDTCRTIYQANYDGLRENVRALHPVIDAWMVTEGYGRTLSRPGLDLARRELCTVAQCAVLYTPRQLHSHARGALHAGAAPAAVEEAITIGADVRSGSEREQLATIWIRVRASWEQAS